MCALEKLHRVQVEVDGVPVEHQQEDGAEQRRAGEGDQHLRREPHFVVDLLDRCPKRAAPSSPAWPTNWTQW